MDYRVFYRKYRPKNFNELVGQDNIKEILSNSIRLNKIAHAYIFTGPRGTGKTSTAKIFAKTLNCINNSSGGSCDKCDMCINYNDNADIIEIDAASNNGVEEIRSLRDSVKIAPYSSKYKVYIIDEVHMLSNSAWNAFLKTLEEPPSHVIFIMATTEINKIPETVLSRCQRFDFSKIPAEKMINHLSNICKYENIDIDDDALAEIEKLSNGCLRDALSYLDKVSKINSKITTSILEETFGVLDKKKLDKLYINIEKGNSNDISVILDDISNSGLTPLNFINEFVEYLLNKIIKSNLTHEKVQFVKELIFKLNNIIINFNATVNPFVLIKVELISINYFPGNNFVDISQENDNDLNGNNYYKSSVDVDEITKEDTNIEKIIGVNNDFNKLRNIRINNSFVEASKENKGVFTNSWKKFVEYLNLNNEYALLGLIENAEICVVSKSNVTFAFKKASESLIFNKNIGIIEEKFNKFNNTKYKFVSLSIDEWNDEKQKFIDNKDKKYVYMDESIIEECVESKDLASDIFGDEIIEIR